MQLAEEYLHRHGIEGVPLVRHVEAGTVFFRNPEGSVPWTILSINFKTKRSGPGYYEVKTLVPTHNGFESGRSFNSNVPAVQVEWEEYEEYLLENFVRGRNKKVGVVSEQTNVVLTAWEIWTYVNDDQLRPFAHNDVFFATVNDKLSVAERHAAYREFSTTTVKSRPHLIDSWTREMMVHIRNYCHWLAQLMDERRA